MSAKNEKPMSDDEILQFVKQKRAERKAAANRKPRPERTQGQGSGYVRGMPFWTHVTTSYGRETR